MTVLSVIRDRSTVPPAKMRPPGPSPEQIRILLEMAAAAPDHGRLVPYRYLIVEGEGRAALGRLFAEGLVSEKPDAAEADIVKQREAPLRAPLLLIAIARVDKDHPKYPAIEQIASAAASVQNVLIAAQALGFASKWATGKNATMAAVRDGLGLAAHEQILGFVYIGSVDELAAPTPGRPQPEAISTRWPQP